MGQKIINSRRELLTNLPTFPPVKGEEEGGCGVTGFACTIPVRGQHIFEPSVQMHNRGNGKGGGIAAVGLSAEDLGVAPNILEEDYLMQIALIDPEVRKEIEATCISLFLRVDKAEKVDNVEDYREVDGLATKPPDVWRYFVRVKDDVLDDFIEKNQFQEMDKRQAEDEFIFQNSFRLNTKFYASLGEQKAFVLSHGRNMCIFKIVGYAEHIIKYYQLENFLAHVWIAHQRYPTRGRVWHPGGAHPFIGLNAALVHNGDFANYYSVSEYLRQRNIYPLFLTDTEVSALLFDLLQRVYQYPLEYIIEALAPTTERDFDLLPPAKQKIYKHIQSMHLHGSPDGPWFFIIAQNEPPQTPNQGGKFQLVGITDTSMLRPQVFALQENEEVQIGLVCSEKQAIDATLSSLAQEDNRFCPIADKYWSVRGGSHTDGGAFAFTIESANGNGKKRLMCTDKFGNIVKTNPDKKHCDMTLPVFIPAAPKPLGERLTDHVKNGEADSLFQYIRDEISRWDYNTLRYNMMLLHEYAKGNDRDKTKIVTALTLLIDRYYNTGIKKRSAVIHIITATLYDIFSSTPPLSENSPSLGIPFLSQYRFIDWETRNTLRGPHAGEETLVIDANKFPPEGDDCDARLICDAYSLGWKRFIAYGYKGQRFCACGLGADTRGVRLDVYGSSGDYLASGIDGLDIYVHGNGQDQLGQIMKSGKLVIYGDVGQTFMYGAKGGEVYVLGNAAGRPLINAVGKPRVVINGTCLDYLAESFMAGEPLEGGGFVVLNGIAFDDSGEVKELPTPYPGSNLFSLASGGAIYVRDPRHQLVKELLNGGEFTPLTEQDWTLILPYLQENERLFGISVADDLLTVDGVKREPGEVYRKVRAIKLAVLTGTIPE